MITYLLITGGIFLTAYVSYRAGKTVSKEAHQEEILKAIEDVRKAKSRINDPNYLKRLYTKYGK